jgi:hypothetical protein
MIEEGLDVLYERTQCARVLASDPMGAEEGGSRRGQILGWYVNDDGGGGSSSLSSSLSSSGGAAPPPPLPGAARSTRGPLSLAMGTTEGRVRRARGRPPFFENRREGQERRRRHIPPPIGLINHPPNAKNGIPSQSGAPSPRPQQQTIVVVSTMENGIPRRSLSFRLSIFRQSLLLMVERTVGRVALFAGGRSS